MSGARSARGAFWALVAALAILHVWAPHGGPAPIVAGLPWDVVVHLAWMVAAGALVAWLTSSALWPDDDDGASR